ncbi:MAG: amidinotransferase [Lewinellaceae bacterium]|nr:amidinotransferase [Saprospiraceae bacterium]MCB9332921.1 amidinotransferase [Lewinellaceae bacterium]
MRKQTTRHILMVRPANFGFNEETAASNAFQRREGAQETDIIRTKAVQEFDAFVQKLRAAGVDVIVAKDSPRPIKPDAVFPNNWATFHQEGFVVTYPMYAPTRRRERRRQVIDTVLKAGFTAERRINLEFNEKINRFLEGTGSIIFDHLNRLAYACVSPRTDAGLLDELCALLNYRKVVFHAVDGNGQEIYHTNVMMAMGETFVVICLDTVTVPAERNLLKQTFRETGKEVVAITLTQMNAFAGNMLQVRNDQEQTILVMSDQAYRSLKPAQIKTLERHTQLLHSPINTIETYGGGSARCMMAEVFLPEQ